MKLTARLEHPAGPVKIGPTIQGAAPARHENFTTIPLKDAHKFIDDIAAMYQGEALTLRDKLVGATFMEDRTLYCVKRAEPIPGLDAVRAIPFVIEIIKQANTSFLNILPVYAVKKIGERTFYGLSYGDIQVDYIFPDR